MRVVSIGDFVTDFYYKDGILLGVNGGMTSHNIIANLAKMKISTAVFGVCGNDTSGKISIMSLEDLKVDVSNVKVLDNIHTRAFHVSYFEENGKLSFISKKRCPKCNKKKWYEESMIDCDYVLNNINEDDILVFDNLNVKNQTIIDNTKNKKIIDLGQYFEFEDLSKSNIIKKIKNKFEIINFNERVTEYLFKKLDVNDELELYKVLKPTFMTITKGSKGATFIYKNNKYDYKLIKEGLVVDSTGAGDAFISSIIKDWINNNYEFNQELFEKWYLNSNKLTYKVVNKMGARSHLNSLYKIKPIDDLCTCDEFEIRIRKQVKRSNININNLESRVINAINSNIIAKLEKIDFKESDNCIFIGTGGSYAAAYYSSRIINELYGCNTYALYPREVLYRNNKNITKVILFSYSGTTNDIITSVNGFNKKDIYIITKGEVQNIVLKTEMLKSNIFSYRTSSNKAKERGFLSFEGALSPASIFFKYYITKINSSINCDDFIKESMKYWKEYLKKIFTKKVTKDIKNKGLVNIFKGDYTNTASYDLESKLIESGILNCILHEKKNFSHGRFINYENLNNNYSVYFKQQITTKYEKELIDYLGNNNIIIESRYNGLLAELDLLIASQFIIYYIGIALDIDVSKPKYSENAMKIYFYKGDL